MLLFFASFRVFYLEPDEEVKVKPIPDEKPATESSFLSPIEFIVSRDFLDPEEGQLELHEGEVVEVMQRTVCGWWFVKNQDGTEGWAPAGFLEPLNPYDTSDLQSENGEF